MQIRQMELVPKGESAKKNGPVMSIQSGSSTNVHAVHMHDCYIGHLRILCACMYLQRMPLKVKTEQAKHDGIK